MKSNNEDLFQNYVIYYRDAGKETIIGTVNKTGSASYTFYLTETAFLALPPSISSLQLGVQNAIGEIAPITYEINFVDNLLETTTIPISSTTAFPKVTNLKFSDSDSTVNEIGGTVSWEDASGYNNFESYMIYFVDSQGTKIKSIAKIGKTYMNRIQMVIPENTTIPSGANAIGVFARAAGQESTISTAAFYHIWDSPRPVIANSYFLDTNDTPGIITANLSWGRLSNETFVSKYLIYYFDYYDNRQVLVSVNKTLGTSSYSYTLTPEEFALIPAYARYLLIAIEDTAGNIIPLPTNYNETVDRTGSKPFTQLPTNVDNTLEIATNASYVYNPINAAHSISWNHPGSSSNIISFELYFLNNEHQKIKSIANIRKSHFGENTVFLPDNIIIPTDARSIAIYSRNANGGESSNYAEIFLINQIRASLDPDNQGIGVDKILKYISAGGNFRREDIQALLNLIDPLISKNVLMN